MSKKKNEETEERFDSDQYEAMPENEDIGDVKIADEVVAVCAINAALKTDGVAYMYTGITDSISQTILGKESVSKGAKISQSDAEIEIDLFVIVEYGVNIPDVAFSIQKNVKKEIESMIDKKVKAVNIHVQGVDLNIGDDTEDMQKEEDDR